ncbi:MAG: single-stranded DNA-binding protein [Gemmatimonadales bacterium]
MSRSLNRVQLIGNLGADPEVRSIANGGRVANVSLATSRRWKGANGENQEKTEWHRLVLWNNRGANLADTVERFCKKGDKIYVEGSIEYRSWQDKEGQTRYMTEINVRELILLTSRGDSGGESFSAGRTAGAAAAAKAKDESFEDFPEALDKEDDDLPF